MSNKSNEISINSRSKSIKKDKKEKLAEKESLKKYLEELKK